MTDRHTVCDSKMGKFSGKKCRLLSMLVLTGFFFFVEIIAGYVTNSMALVADSFHMLGDIAALVISFLSVKVNRSNLNLDWRVVDRLFFLKKKTSLMTIPIERTTKNDTFYWIFFLSAMAVIYFDQFMLNLFRRIS